MDDLAAAPATEIDPYTTLGVPETAKVSDIKSAYRKLALKHHPDKVPPPAKEVSKRKFQTIVSAYAILSDERRRRRYDATGNTSESLDLDDDDFNWSDFFRAQWSEVTTSSIDTYKDKYQGSDEEKRDVIAAYKKWEGNMSRVFQTVVLCNVLDDEGRFRRWIDEEIEEGRVENYDKYCNETEQSKQQRRKAAEKEAQEAEARFDELDKGKPKGKKGDTGDLGDLGDLAAMIQQRQQLRATNFLDDLEAKYAAPTGAKKGGKTKKRKVEEPPEEAFQKRAANGGRAGKRMKSASKEASRLDEDDEDEVVDLYEHSEESERSETEWPAPRPKPAINSKGTKAKGKGKRGRSRREAKG